MGLAGAVIGGILSGAVIYVANMAKITFDFGRQTGLILSATINPLDLITVSGIVIVVSILASFQPALKAARMDPIQALGHV
jgi:putative ABC transport system permease protein